MELTQEYLKTVLNYDSETGVWTWLYRKNARAQWNSQFSGKPAGGLDPSTGYLRIRIADKLYYAHRLAFLYILGNWPINQGDHENLDRADCRWENLRDATRTENNTNKTISSRNTSGFKGVYYDPNGGRWTSCFQMNRRRFRRCGFATAELAYEAYCKDALEHGGEFARLA